jgi:hypothetical protein
MTFQVFGRKSQRATVRLPIWSIQKESVCVGSCLRKPNPHDAHGLPGAFAENRFLNALTLRVRTYVSHTWSYS